MAIVFPLDLPASPGIESSRFGLEFNNTVFTSPVNKVSQVLRRPGNLWSGLYKLPPMVGAQARTWKAWLTSLGGTAGTFKGFDPDARTPQGSAQNGQGLVNGAGQTGNSLATDGWPASITGLLLPGDYVQLGNQLKLITEQVDSDALGNATLNFEPALHKSPVDNGAVIVVNPVGVFRLVEDAAAAWEADRVGAHGFSFAFIEVPEVI